MLEREFDDYVYDWERKYFRNPYRTSRAELLFTDDIFVNDKIMITRAYLRRVVHPMFSVTGEMHVLEYVNLDYMKVDEDGDINDIITLDVQILEEGEAQALYMKIMSEQK